MASRLSNRRGKVITIDQGVLNALQGLARDRGVVINTLADEAFRDLLKKHGRPVTLKDALRQSARAVPANDRGGRPARGRS